MFEDGVPPRFRLAPRPGPPLGRARFGRDPAAGRSRQIFAFADRGGFLETVDEIPEPHEFAAEVTIEGRDHAVAFEERDHAEGAAARDNNMRAAIVHVLADATVSVMVIVGLLLARAFGWLWMDPLVGIVGALRDRELGRRRSFATPERSCST